MDCRLLKEAYKQLADVTPLKTDCGRRCSRACCHSSGHMILFPGEDKLLTGKGFVIEKSVLSSYGPVNILSCNGVCDREWRPLSCRIFPLAPKVMDGRIYVRMDARGRPICELTHGSLQSLNVEFVEAVKESLRLIAEDEEGAAFITALSNRVDAFMSFNIG